MLERVLIKVTSSKFWGFAAVFALSVVSFTSASEDTAAKIAAMILALGDLIVYTCSNVAQKKIERDGEVAEIERVTVDTPGMMER